VPEPDPVTDPPTDVDAPPLGVLPVGAPGVEPVTLPPVVDDVLDVSVGLTVGDDVGLGEVVVCPCFFVAEEVGVAFGALVGDALTHPPEVPLGFGFALGELLVALPVGVALAVPVGLLVAVPLGVTVGLGPSVGVTWGVLVAVDGLTGGLLVVLVGDGLVFGEVLGDA
jgi:hypothetical protein